MAPRSQESFESEAHFSRYLVARFDSGTKTSDAGAVLLRETDRRPDLLPRLAACFEDRCQLILHTVPGLIAQSVCALTLGYEDLSDHDQLREDTLLAARSGKRCLGQEALAGQEALWRPVSRECQSGPWRSTRPHPTACFLPVGLRHIVCPEARSPAKSPGSPLQGGLTRAGEAQVQREPVRRSSRRAEYCLFSTRPK
jgi:hypothetical protein